MRSIEKHFLGTTQIKIIDALFAFGICGPGAWCQGKMQRWELQCNLPGEGGSNAAWECLGQAFSGIFPFDHQT